jgi:predicted DNA binding CopG/RHH family protein
MTAKIEDTNEAWESGQLGRDAEFTVALSGSELEQEHATIEDAFGLKAISIRLEKELIDDFKMIAQYNGMSYQPLMRQALHRFAQGELKKMAADAFNAQKEAQREAQQKKAA